ncbi:hypothetical protein GOBAR_DD07362 [Gossypium barbadense]|nr:hypothetical protein GOBAR_DD07362 [Gossypium barbadense]
MVDVEGDFQGQSLEDAEEEEAVRLEASVFSTKESLETCLIGTFLTYNVINFPSMRATLVNVWHLIGGIMIFDLFDGRFLYKLFLKVLVQDLPHGFSSKLVARQMGNFIGQFINYDCKAINLGYIGVLRALFRHATALSSRWLREEGAGAPEMKLQSRWMEEVCRPHGYLNGIDMPSVGNSGGLSLGWKSSIYITLRSFSNSHIDVLINEDTSGKCWQCTGLYGVPQKTRREESWDFNEILFSFEKKGGLLRSDRQMRAFSAAPEDCELEDMGYEGVCNNIMERLDRAIANGVWSTTFQLYKIRRMMAIEIRCNISNLRQLGFLRKHVKLRWHI